MQKDFKLKNKNIAGIVICLLSMIMIIVTGMGFFGPKLPDIPSVVKGTLYIDGYLISGSVNRYWKIDLPSNNVQQMMDDEISNAIELAELYFNSYTVNMTDNKTKIKKKKQQNDFLSTIGFLTKTATDFFGFATRKNNVFNRRLKLLQKDKLPSNLLTKDNRYNLKFDDEKNLLQIKDLKTNGIKEIKFDNDICCLAISPDSEYLALLEYQPYIFNDGKTYLLLFIDLKSGKKYSISNTLVSMPHYMSWEK
ncbi:MAG: hypothetical protein AB1782_04110 [Cyanobacteriota bacterium]